MLHGMWDLPRSGIEPMYPALESRFFTTDLPGKPSCYLLGSRKIKSVVVGSGKKLRYLILVYDFIVFI